MGSDCVLRGTGEDFCCIGVDSKVLWLCWLRMGKYIMRSWYVHCAG